MPEPEPTPRELVLEEVLLFVGMARDERRYARLHCDPGSPGERNAIRRAEAHEADAARTLAGQEEVTDPKAGDVVRWPATGEGDGGWPTHFHRHQKPYRTQANLCAPAPDGEGYIVLGLEQPCGTFSGCNGVIARITEAVVASPEPFQRGKHNPELVVNVRPHFDGATFRRRYRVPLTDLERADG